MRLAWRRWAASLHSPLRPAQSLLNARLTFRIIVPESNTVPDKFVHASRRTVIRCPPHAERRWTRRAPEEEGWPGSTVPPWILKSPRLPLLALSVVSLRCGIWSAIGIEHRVAIKSANDRAMRRDHPAAYPAHADRRGQQQRFRPARRAPHAEARTAAALRLVQGARRLCQCADPRGAGSQGSRGIRRQSRRGDGLRRNEARQAGEDFLSGTYKPAPGERVAIIVSGGNTAAVNFEAT